MRSSIRYTFLAILLSLFIFQGFVYAQKAPPKNDSVKSTENSELIFPEIDGWEKGSISTFPTDELGYAFNYESDIGGRITVYVFDMGIKNIADGVDSKDVKAQLKEAERQVKGVADLGYMEKLKKIKSETITLGGKDGTVKALFTQYTYESKDSTLVSEIYVFGYNKNFIKFRATRVKEGENVRNLPMEDFYKAMEKLFSK